MPLSSSLVGLTAAPLTHEIDARWLMAYAAGLGDSLPCYLDTLRPGGIVGHPMFSVCFQWPAMVAIRDLLIEAGLSPDEALRGVHATHDVINHRTIHPGQTLTTRATVVGIEKRRSGAFLAARLDSHNADGTHICSTLYGTTYLNTAVEGPDRPVADWPAVTPPPQIPPTPHHDKRVEVSAVAAHVYTECARIWNPVHTDPQAAARAGLPAIILHGTATMALAASRIAEIYAPGEPQRIGRIAGRFTAMVPMPSQLSVRVVEHERRNDEEHVYYEVLNGQGQRAISSGLIAVHHKV